MGKDRTRRTAAAAAFAVALGGAAIGGAVAAAQATTPTVKVTMQEFRLTAPAKLPVGRVTIVAVNSGKLSHALAIRGPGVNVRTPIVAPGRSARLSVSLKTGSYTLWCPVGNHASAGMKLTVRVAAAGAAPAPPATPPATTTTGGGYDDPGGYGY